MTKLAHYGSRKGATFFIRIDKKGSSVLFGENILTLGKLTEATAEYESQDTRNGGLA